MKVLILGIVFFVASCSKAPAPLLNPNPAPPQEATKPFLTGPAPGFTLTPAVRFMVTEAEGFVSKPEAPDARYSGISFGYGYDASTNAPYIIEQDWAPLPSPQPHRLAATHPYIGRAAQAHVHEVADIRVPRKLSDQVFDAIDVPRVYVQCKRAFPGFDGLAYDAQSVLASLVFNRGASMVGESRREMREIRFLVPSKNYKAIAGQIRAMERVWRGTEIFHGMVNRREAEARIMEKCR